MEFRIERVGPGDWRAYVELRQEMLRTEPAAYGSDLAREAAFPAELWQERLSVNWTFLAYPAEWAGKPIGSATGLWVGDGDTLVVAMYVAADYRRQGCARLLLDQLAQVARDHGGTRLLLDVTDRNEEATRCYAGYGFVATGRERPMDRAPTIIERQFAFDL